MGFSRIKGFSGPGNLEFQGRGEFFVLSFQAPLRETNRVSQGQRMFIFKNILQLTFSQENLHFQGS